MRYEVGELIHFNEGITILVVMAGHEGVRYIEPSNLTFDEEGNVQTKYLSIKFLDESSASPLGTIDVIAQRRYSEQYA